MSSMKHSQINKFIIVRKTVLENQAKITVFLFQISITERNQLLVNSVDLVDSHLSFTDLPRVLWPMHS